jgi:NAD(P)H-dependent FMN reductase
MSSKQLAIIWHSRTGATQKAVDLMLTAINQFIDEQQLSALVIAVRAEQADLATLLSSDALIFACPENLASMSGVMKEFFDQLYYPALGQLNGRVFGILVAAGSDGTGAVRQIERIATGWRLRSVAPALIIGTHAQSAEQIAAEKHLSTAQQSQITEFAQTIAAHVFLL